ncbi:endonuclease domain-containing protein [Microbacterium sp. SSM24]|uniref:endonuclease domain-containing protein n=1 Tax=Microbacterium sp. SSM24 TaxID=2991714 RepID=UPI002226A360|nr:endonuclease domain-containing protein [Microbacterium sp. SSM24]MCW3493088.1 endonuclease domain-containing protein [Microbacterium sp. SSM24]
MVGGVPAESPVRAWRQAAAHWGLDDLIAAAEFLVHPRRGLATIEELAAEVEAMGDVGGGLLTQSLALVRVGSESPEETALRLLLIRAGLPEPAINVDLRASSGRFIARLDLAYVEYRVAIEYDGRIHAENDRQFRRDADRWDDIRAAGWQHVRILSHHVRPDPRVAVRKVMTALGAAGWPGSGIRPLGHVTR